MEEMRNESWEAITPPENAEQEMANIRKTIKKQNWKTILTSIVLVIALLLGTIYGIMPLAEKFYWDPLDSSFDQYNTDLHLILDAYAELFLPGQTLSVLAGRTGFADYELNITMMDAVRDTRQHLTGRLNKGQLGFDYAFFDWSNKPAFHSAIFPEYPASAWERNRKEVREKLEQLPKYIRLEAAVTFPEDITMAQLLKIMEYDYIGNLGDLKVIWAAIRTQEVQSESSHHSVGISFVLSPLDGGINEAYPEFYLSCYEPSGETLEQHFKSLMQFSSDLMLDGKAVLTWHEDHNFYQEALAYVEENGVNSYGCIVTGTPETMLALLDSGDILDMELMDAWIELEDDWIHVD